MERRREQAAGGAGEGARSGVREAVVGEVAAAASGLRVTTEPKETPLWSEAVGAPSTGGGTGIPGSGEGRRTGRRVGRRCWKPWRSPVPKSELSTGTGALSRRGAGGNLLANLEVEPRSPAGESGEGRGPAPEGGE